MSTIKDIIRRVDDTRPNAFSDETKLRWLCELDGRIAANVFLMGIEEIRQLEYKGEEGLDKEPLISFPHDGIYDLWLAAQIDAANGEYNRYQNTMQLYNESYGDFVRWFAAVYAPAQMPYGSGFVPRDDVPAYYLTAYGIALKRGFVGTVDEWLESLRGIRPVFTIGTVETLEWGEKAWATVEGTQENPVLNLGIPRSTDADLDLKAYVDQQLQGIPKMHFTPDGTEPEGWEEGDWWATPEEYVNE